MKRIRIDISYCNNSDLQKINPLKKCKSKKEMQEYAKSLDMTVFYNKKLVDLNNLTTDNKEPMKNLFRKDN